MKKFFLTGTFIVFTIPMFGHTAGKPFTHETRGQIVYKERTVDVIFVIPVNADGLYLENIQNKVHYLDKDGHRRTLHPKEVQGIRFKWYGDDVRMISKWPGHHTIRKKFMHVAVEGKIKVYEYVKTYRSSTPRSSKTYVSSRYTIRTPWPAKITSQTVVYQFLQRDGEKDLLIPRTIGFRRQMRKYFDDYPWIKEMIDEKLFKHKDLKVIVELYNANRGQ